MDLRDKLNDLKEAFGDYLDAVHDELSSVHADAQVNAAAPPAAILSGSSSDQDALKRAHAAAVAGNADRVVAQQDDQRAAELAGPQQGVDYDTSGRWADNAGVNTSNTSTFPAGTVQQTVNQPDTAVAPQQPGLLVDGTKPVTTDPDAVEKAHRLLAKPEAQQMLDQDPSAVGFVAQRVAREQDAIRTLPPTQPDTNPPVDGVAEQHAAAGVDTTSDAPSEPEPPAAAEQDVPSVPNQPEQTPEHIQQDEPPAA